MEDPDYAPTTLLVEDHLDTLRALIMLFTMKGLHVLPARTFAEAVAIAKASHPQLLVTDVQLPDGSGWDLLARLRADHPHLVGITLTAHAYPEHISLSEAAGYCAHVVKPPLDGELESALERCAVYGSQGRPK